jgi:SAM-dependent methyltransferase
MQRRAETWDSFWGRLLRIDAMEAMPQEYRRLTTERAHWLAEVCGLPRERPVLSLACGEGGHELALARLGYTLHGIDRNPVLIEFAAAAAQREGLPASFAVADLREEPRLPTGFGAAFCFDTLGLLGQAAEAQLFRRLRSALEPGAPVFVDSPRPEGLTTGRTWQPLRQGYLLLESDFDPDTRLLTINPLFIEAGAEIVELHDAYDSQAGPHTGVRRYIYPPDELAQLLELAGFAVTPVEHLRSGHYMLRGQAC